MAIGDNGNQNSNGTNRSTLYESQYYSRLKIKNDEAKLTLSFSFRSGLLQIDINEIQEGFKYSPIQSIFLSPTKAYLLVTEITKFKAYYLNGAIVEGKAFGVNAGMKDKVSYIGFHANLNNQILITIGKFDNSGNIIEQATIPLNKDYHYSLEWDNINDMDVSKCYDDLVELEQILKLLSDFSNSMSGASAYSYADLMRYDLNKQLRSFDPIYDKLGIERRSNNNFRSNSFLENSKRSSSNSTTIDQMEDELFD